MNRAAQIGVLAVLVAGVVAFAIVRESGRSNAGESASAPTGRQSAGEIPRLVDLGSTTCVPCKMIAPILEELQTEYEGRFGVEVIDIKAD
ncbi:MAG: thioredoxin, partial [Candidatus Latescibacterota bacterium]